MTPMHLTPDEITVYSMLCAAADAGEVCPLNLDIEMELGFNSGSMGPKMIARLEAKGWIVVKRYQKYREVLIVETGRSTVRCARMLVERPHVPRGLRSGHGGATNRKSYRGS